MIDYRRIYREEAERYNALVTREDVEGNLLPAIESIRNLRGCNVIELGAGTGRLTRLLIQKANKVIVLDRSGHMLGFAKQNMPMNMLTHCHLSLGDNRCLPIKSALADIVIAGWSLGHMVGWYPTSWQAEIDLILAEMNRALRPGGTAIIIESLGTGRKNPQPPTDDLAAYYNWLESTHDFRSTWIRTDYQFRTRREAMELTRFFFGDEIAAVTASDPLLRLPECSGIWWLDKSLEGT